MDLSIIELVKVVILGVVEGLTEWLPVSSTGHMILVDEFIKLDVDKKFMDMFLVVIQLGAILAVVALNFEKLNPWSDWKTRQEKRVRTHNAGRGGKYTRARLPVRLVYFETFADKREAQSREWHIKQLTHAQKQNLINDERK